MSRRRAVTLAAGDTVRLPGHRHGKVAGVIGAFASVRMRSGKLRAYELHQLRRVPEIRRSATIDPTGRYRYALRRDFDAGGRAILFVMLNPSTADAENDDATLKRVMAFAEAWGYVTVLVGNLFALRSRYPEDLFNAGDPIGPDNDRHLLALADEAETIVCAWGGHQLAWKRAPEVYDLLADHRSKLKALRRQGSGAPHHPLYVKASVDLVPFEPYWRAGTQ